MLRPFMVLLLAVAIVAVAFWLVRRGRPALDVRRRGAAVAAAVVAVSTILVAVWASTHEYYAGEVDGKCTPLSSNASGSCRSEARAWAAGAIIGAGVALGGVVLVVRGPRAPRS